jgi:Fe/S biogenesis protein NfuA
LDKNPLEAGLAKFGITLQKVDVPQRIKGRQNVLFLGNVLNHYRQEEQARELDRIAANMAEGDIVIVQMDEPEMCSIEVLHVNGQEDPKARERVRWINTRTLEVQKLVRGSGSWRQIHLKPAVDRGMRRLMECLGLKLNSPEWSQEAHKALVHRHINHVFRTFFRAWPVEEIFRIAIREAVRRLPSEGGPKGIPVFEDDATDAYGGALGLDPSPLVSEADFVSLRSEPTARGETRAELETGVSLPGAPSVTITEFAMRRILELREGLGLPVKGLRVKAIPRSPLRADFSMRFVPAEEPESPTDSVQSVDGIDLYIAPDSAPYLEGATIDLVFRIIGSELTVVAPPRTQDTPAGRIAARIQQVLEEEINPSLATHGGEAILIDYKDDIVFLELTGGCQGCSSASATLKDGIEKSIRKSVPEVQEVRDVTQHANGTNPYFR